MNNVNLKLNSKVKEIIQLRDVIQLKQLNVQIFSLTILNRLIKL